jgi:heme o synthase
VLETRARSQVSWLSSAVALLAFMLIVVAGLDLGVSGGTNWTSISRPESAIGAAHLTVAFLTGIATIMLVIIAWLRLHDDGRIIRAASMSLALILIQAFALATPASRANPSWATTVHVGATALLLATALYLGTLQFRTEAAAHQHANVSLGLARVVHLTTLSVFAVLLSGAYLTASGEPSSCTGWPVCSGNTPLLASLSDAHMLHRLLVAISGTLLVVVSVAFMRSHTARFFPIAIMTVFAVEVAVGAMSATGTSSALVSGTHFGAAGLAWGLLVVLGLTIQLPLSATRTPGVALGNDIRSLARDYLRVTKPGIMVLLLTTTLGAMFIAPGWPSLWLVIATLVGGALASGGASALNCYLDRDIDIIMARTRKRPIPTGRLSATRVRNFGLLLSALAVIELWVLVNPVAALLALSGNVFYVLVYTKLLKRSTPQNIVIGGAAGAFPPLVGWAAVTGSISLTPLLLFAIIYYWTPPHFWSLALLKARDYERAGIPMLPVTHGERVTRRFILLYSLLLVGVTLLIVPAGAGGMLYLGAALALGLIFVALATRMYLEDTTRLAWRLFKFSNYYLALLLLAMVIDQAIAL